MGFCHPEFEKCHLEFENCHPELVSESEGKKDAEISSGLYNRCKSSILIHYLDPESSSG